MKTTAKCNAMQWYHYLEDLFFEFKESRTVATARSLIILKTRLDAFADLMVTDTVLLGRANPLQIRRGLLHHITLYIVKDSLLDVQQLQRLLFTKNSRVKEPVEQLLPSLITWKGKYKINLNRFHHEQK